MDESQIAAQVAQNIPKDEPVVESPTERPTTDEPSAFDSNVALQENPALALEIADYLGVSSIDRYNSEVQGSLREIFRWAANRSRSGDIGDVLAQIAALEAELGLTYKPNKLSVLSRWVKLNAQSESLRKQMEYLRG